MNQNNYESTLVTTDTRGDNVPSGSVIDVVTISKEVLQAHSTREDCWVAYNGKVYDITSFLPNHPGSAERIMPYCGTSDEFKTAFERKHGTTKVAVLMKVGTFIGDFDVMGDLA